MIYCIIGLVALALATAALLWRNHDLKGRLDRLQAQRGAAVREGESREKLQRALAARSTEIQRLRRELNDWRLDCRDLEAEMYELKATLVEETNRRVAAEKEDDTRDLQRERLERELTEARLRLRNRENQARQNEARLCDTIRLQGEELERLRESQPEPAAPNAAPRRPRRPRPEPARGQITVDDILAEDAEA